MIWFLLYPLRGTTEPPKLSPSHPIRRAFQAHGTATARHWLLSLVVTISVSVLLCYPAVFQTNSPAAAGLRNLPKHVWTSTTEIESERPVDVVVRQVWVHGDYMSALNQTVLRKALDVQYVLISTGFDAGGSGSGSTTVAGEEGGCITPGPGEGWGWQSPLMYWDCSRQALERDKDILNTINARSTDRTSMNLTLRPSTVFAGKHFTNSKLQAADALVLTLFERSEHPDVGDSWNARAKALAQVLEKEWIMFPEDGQVSRNSLYEFRLKPMSRLDDLFLAGSYMITSIYVIWKMMQLRAVKSWFGLLITIGAKMSICIIASFSLCTWLGIDLARIPRPWFPAVVFCYGLGNIFRLINAVLETPPEMPPQQRIGNALGEVGHLSLAVAFQNLALIYTCSRFVSPWVADFCVFAAVTLVFDFVYHLTFFVAVLSVDVQRMELSDSIGQAELVHGSRRKKRPERQPWFAALIEGTTPLSTRFAGTVAIFSIILAINWHFFDANDQHLSFATVRRKLLSRRQRRSNGLEWSSPPINQARTPAEWLQLHDHNTARELFALIKPGAHSFIASIYDPILIVQKGAHGRDKPQMPTTLMGYLQRFAQGHTFPAALMAVFLIAGVTLLMNYLLWTGLPEAKDEDEVNEDSFSVKTLPTQHTLDVAHITSCCKGHLMSVSLDRTTSIWVNGRSGYIPTTLQTASMKPKLWPVVASALDESGAFLAIANDAGRIGMWSVTASRFVMFPHVDLRGQVPALFSFVNITRNDNERPYVMIFSPDGHLTELEARTGIHRTKRVSASAVLCAQIYVNAKGEASLVFVCKPGEVHILSLQDPNNTSSEVVASLDPGPPPDSNPSKVQCIQSVPSLGLIFALRDKKAEIFDFSSKALIYAFEIGHVKPHSFRVTHSARRQCSCGASAVQTISVVYAEQDKEHMIMQTFSPDPSRYQICLAKPLDRVKHNCRGLESATEAVFCVESAGVWESTSTCSVVGVRRRMQSSCASPAASDEDDDDENVPNSAAPTSAVRQRSSKPASVPVSSRIANGLSNGLRYTLTPTDEADVWEAWSLSVTGEFRSRPLLPDDCDEMEDDVEDELFVVAPGPIARLGKRGVAVAFGNTVKIITLGKELFDGMTVPNGGLDIGLGSYRARGRRGTDRKAL